MINVKSVVQFYLGPLILVYIFYMYAPEYALYIFMSFYFLAFVFCFTGLFAIIFSLIKIIIIESLFYFIFKTNKKYFGQSTQNNMTTPASTINFGNPEDPEDPKKKFQELILRLLRKSNQTQTKKIKELQRELKVVRNATDIFEKHKINETQQEILNLKKRIADLNKALKKAQENYATQKEKNRI